MGKKRLRRELGAAQHRADVLAQQRLELLGEQQRILDSLAQVGFVWTGGERRQPDRIRAARAGVIVLDDVYLVAEPQYRIERQSFPTMFQGDVPGRLDTYFSLELTGDPAVLAALADYIRQNPR